MHPRCMAEIQLMVLTERMSDDEIKELADGLEQLGAPRLPATHSDDSITIAENLDDDAVEEFLERLNANDLACDIYLPMEFEGTVEIGDLVVGSAHILLEGLEELKDELTSTEDEDEEEYDDDDEDEVAELTAKQLNHLWRLFNEGAQAAIDKNLPLHVQT